MFSEVRVYICFYFELDLVFLLQFPSPSLFRWSLSSRDLGLFLGFGFVLVPLVILAIK